MVNANPSVNPANNGSMVGMMQEVLSKFLQNTDDMLPATVIAYDRQSNMATVRPLIEMVTTEGERVARAQVASIPVFQIGGGNYILSFPINPGDLGWIKANDRDISLFVQGNYEQSAPNTARKHSFSDAVFFPHVMKGYTIDGEDAGNAVLQTLDGSIRIALWPDKVKITGNLLVDGNINATGDIIAGTISLQNHVHSGVQPGAGNTGAPVV